MTSDQLKEGFQNDLEGLKKLNLGIIPAKIYYLNVFLQCLLVFALFLCLQLSSCYVAVHSGAWPYVGENESRDTLGDKFEDSIDEALDDPTGLMEFSPPPIDPRVELKDRIAQEKEIEARLLKRKQELAAARIKRKQLRDKEESKSEEHYHVIRVAKMVGGVIGSSLFFMLFFVGKVKNYVIFKHQLKPKLQTGQYLAKKISLAFKAYFTIFWLFTMITIPLFDQDMTFFAGIAAFIFSGVIISFVINLEASRIGVSVLSSALVNYFDTTQKKHPKRLTLHARAT